MRETGVPSSGIVRMKWKGQTSLRTAWPSVGGSRTLVLQYTNTSGEPVGLCINTRGGSSQEPVKKSCPLTIGASNVPLADNLQSCR